MQKRLLCLLLCLFACLSALAPAMAEQLSGGSSSEPAIQAVYREHSSPVREDYPHLSDEEFANFRCVSTTGMGKNVLYRSSSPVNPELNRDYYADAAARDAGIRTALNLADNQKELASYEWYAGSYYSGIDVCLLNMNQNRTSKGTRKKLAKGLRYLISHDGPYLVHCTMGRDRTGFVCAILECLMGASVGEVVDDYMATNYNFYGMVPGLEIYDTTQQIIRDELATVFGVDNIAAEGVDLVQCAEAYLLGLGLTPEELAALKDRLGTDRP